MKKILSLLIVFTALFLLSGCSLAKTKITKCTLTSDQSASGYVLDSTYEIYSKGDVVYKVSTKEVVTSKNNTVLQYFEKTLKDQYKSSNDIYGGYSYDVKTKDGKVSSTVTIDYNKMDLNKFVKNNTAMKSYVNKNNKLTLEGAKKLYESLGATCK